MNAWIAQRSELQEHHFVSTCVFIIYTLQRKGFQTSDSPFHEQTSALLHTLRKKCLAGFLQLGCGVCAIMRAIALNTRTCRTCIEGERRFFLRYDFWLTLSAKFCRLSKFEKVVQTPPPQISSASPADTQPRVSLADASVRISSASFLLPSAFDRLPSSYSLPLSHASTRDVTGLFTMSVRSWNDDALMRVCLFSTNRTAPRTLNEGERSKN